MKKYFLEIIDSIASKSSTITDVSFQKKMDFALDNARDMVEYGEQVIAFETLCDNLYELAFPLTTSMYSDLENLGKALAVDKSRWQFLRELFEDKPVRHKAHDDRSEARQNGGYSRYTQMRDNGLSPLEVVQVAKGNGMDTLNLVKMLRRVFRLSLSEASDAVNSALK
jgi:hypothetical protein